MLNTAKNRQLFRSLTCKRFSQKHNLVCITLLCSLVPLLSGYCYNEAASYYGVSPEVLQAISYVESQFSPNAINLNKNGSYDYGLMQINTCWYSALGPERWQALADPCYSAYVGAWILRQCQDRYGYRTWDYISCYHTGLPLGRSTAGYTYVGKVRSALRGGDLYGPVR